MARKETGSLLMSISNRGPSGTRSYGDEIKKALEERGMTSELAASKRIAHWAYSQTEAAKRSHVG